MPCSPLGHLSSIREGGSKRGHPWFSPPFKGELSGAYIADLVVQDSIILELKSVSSLNRVMQVQLLDYLQLSGKRVGYLLNFQGTSLQWKRMVR